MASPKLLKRIQQLLAQIITYEMSDPRIKFASVTKVELSKDNRYCTAYISILGEKPQQRTVMRGIEHAKVHIQNKLGNRLDLRHTPILKFVEDHSIEKSIEMSKLLKELVPDSSKAEEKLEEQEEIEEEFDEEVSGEEEESDLQ